MTAFRIRLIGFCGLAGVVILIISFVINPGPGPNPTVHQLIEFKNAHYVSAIIGSWMQAISPPLIVTYALGLVSISGMNGSFAGSLSFLGGLILLMVSMIEVTFYFSALNGKVDTTAMISMDLISAVQRLYSIVAAPFFFWSLSAVLIQSHVLPKVFGYIGILLGLAFFTLGIIQLFSPVQDTVNMLSMAQGLWWMASAITLIIRAGKLSFPRPERC